MADDVIVNKAGNIERCLRGITEEYGGGRSNLFDNQTRPDAIVLNLQRACERSIHMAMHVIRRRRLGLPQESRTSPGRVGEPAPATGRLPQRRRA